MLVVSLAKKGDVPVAANAARNPGEASLKSSG
jgi:hypothetical protein